MKITGGGIVLMMMMMMTKHYLPWSQTLREIVTF